MPGSWSDFLKLRSGPAPEPSPEAGAVRVYADVDGALRSVQSDGTDAPIGGGGGAFSGVGLRLLADATGLSTPPPVEVHWTTTDYDTDSYLDASGDFVAVPFAGVYLVTLSAIGTDANGLDGYFDLSVAYDSTPAVPAITVEVPYAGANGEFDVALADTVSLHAGDLIIPSVNLRASGADTITLYAGATRFAVTFLGAP